MDWSEQAGTHHFKKDEKDEEFELLPSTPNTPLVGSPSSNSGISPSLQTFSKSSDRNPHSISGASSPSIDSNVTSPHVAALQQLFNQRQTSVVHERQSSHNSHSSSQHTGNVSSIHFAEEDKHDGKLSNSSSRSSFFLPDHYDDVQRTVKSMGEISVDTQDSATYQNTPFPCGNIRFAGKREEGAELKKHYVCVPWDSAPYDLTFFMDKFWNMRSPKIVLSIISGVHHFKVWKNPRMKDQFKKGIIRAANRTEMWVITNGIDDGVSSMIGEAVQEENILRANSRYNLSQLRPDAVKKFHKLTMIGVMPKHKISYQHLLDGSDCINVTNEGCKFKKDIYEFNPDHTHFVMVETETPDDKEKVQYVEFRFNFERQLQCQLGRPRRYKRLLSFDARSMSSDDETSEIIEPTTQPIPVIGLVIQGSPRGIDLVLFYLRNKMPIVVVKGSGGCADLLAYAIEESQERPDGDYEEHHLKPELLKMIVHTFPNTFKENDFAKNVLRDKILECVSLATEDERTFVTILNTQGWDANLADLDKYILKALFKSEIKSNSRWRERAYKDLTLLLDWNRPDLAQSEIFSSRDFSRIKVDKTLFEKSLIRTDREEFVSLFLDQGFLIHKYLNHKHLKYLFDKAEDSEFFTTVCLEGVLGKTHIIPDQPLPQDFLVNDLNKLVAKLSGIKDFVQPYELSMNSVELYMLDPVVAERKAINCLIIWAVLFSRPKLAKVLWYRCDEPIPVALICSNMYRELSKCSMELYQRTEMEACAKEFGMMALGVLDISYSDVSAQAYAMLSKPLPDFNNKSAIEIAYDASYGSFIAHPCCQKWLTRKLFGSIQVKELDWGICRLPYWFKILSSVFFFFPMFFWIVFGRSAGYKNKGLTMNDLFLVEDDISSSSSEEDPILPFTRSGLVKELNGMKRKSLKHKISGALRAKRHRKLPVWKQMNLLWTAPITKFWITQLFYFIYLGIFSLAVLWPTCGNLYLDTVVWVWTLIMLTELIRHTYVKHQRHKSMLSMWSCIEILLMFIFIVFYLFLRIMPQWINYSDIYVSKTVLSMGLIFFFYRLPHVYLPMSPTLGPMLVRMNRMIRVDFVSFVRMFLIFMISGGVTIQAILYPNFPLGTELIKRVVTRPLFAMFLTQIHDLDGDPDCSPHYANLTTSYCATDAFHFRGSHMYKPEPLVEPVQKCPMSSLGGYIITIQYLLICKLVLVTLLFAMFALTITKVDLEAAEIWKFQRYMIIMDFEDRLCFPPPFTIINYLFIFLTFIHRLLKGCMKKCSDFCTCDKLYKTKKSESHKKTKRSEDYNYWKKCSHDYVNAKEEKLQMEDIPKVQAEILQNMQDDLRFQKKTIKRMTDRIFELERMIQSSRMYLENISHKLDKSDVLGVSTVKGLLVHVAARQSPYPGTTVTRFPVFDKYVPWEQPYEVYDAKIYTKSRDSFSEDERLYVDEDIILIKQQRQKRNLLSEEERAELPPLPSINIVWNKIVTSKLDVGTQMYDRRSWVMLDNQICRYKIDPLGVPLNPMGRTGLRGKGVLWRWGPNHEILAVCTRWRRIDTLEGQPQGYLYVEGKKVLEFIAVRKDDESEDSCFGLPGGALHGLISPYSTLVEAFAVEVLDEHIFEGKPNLDQGDLIQYFSQFAAPNLGSIGNIASRTSINFPIRSLSQPCVASYATSRAGSKTSLRTDIDSSGFSATMLYKGYIDDPRNTDSAWVEAEVWNFHYDSSDTFDVKLPEETFKVTWKEVSPNVKIFGNEGVIVQEAAKIQDAYY
ncbi:transient receptor potential cation channel subfamily M member-like 2 isoform X3 [Mytilus galloprovincialis]|uniref:transient receptor potential cation channel subfamily M member-like 2 isoform X3 n=1 Tax=Mytilus galloprovincialis TaxID=29158 RepID=UPI003F7B8A9E